MEKSWIENDNCTIVCRKPFSRTSQLTYLSYAIIAATLLLDGVLFASGLFRTATRCILLFGGLSCLITSLRVLTSSSAKKTSLGTLLAAAKQIPGSSYVAMSSVASVAISFTFEGAAIAGALVLGTTFASLAFVLMVASR